MATVNFTIQNNTGNSNTQSNIFTITGFPNETLIITIPEQTPNKGYITYNSQPSNYSGTINWNILPIQTIPTSIPAPPTAGSWSSGLYASAPSYYYNLAFADPNDAMDGTAEFCCALAGWGSPCTGTYQLQDNKYVVISNDPPAVDENANSVPFVGDYLQINDSTTLTIQYNSYQSGAADFATLGAMALINNADAPYNYEEFAVGCCFLVIADFLVANII